MNTPTLDLDPRSLPSPPGARLLADVPLDQRKTLLGLVVAALAALPPKVNRVTGKRIADGNALWAMLRDERVTPALRVADVLRATATPSIELARIGDAALRGLERADELRHELRALEAIEAALAHPEAPPAAPEPAPEPKAKARGLFSRATA